MMSLNLIQIKDIINLIRLKQWSKNLILFIPLFFDKNFLNLIQNVNLYIGLISFCTISSLVYVINDISDKDKDKNNIYRLDSKPIANGKLEKIQYNFILIFLIITNLFILVLNFILNQFEFNYILIIYFLLNILYTFKLKEIPYLEVLLITIFYLLRLLSGFILLKIQFSLDLGINFLLLILILIITKRLSELYLNHPSIYRKSLKFYKKEYFKSTIYLLSCIEFVFYLYFITKESSILKFGDYIYLNTILVFFSFMRLGIKIYKLDRYINFKNIIITDQYILFFSVIWFIIFLVYIF